MTSTGTRRMRDMRDDAGFFQQLLVRFTREIHARGLEKKPAHPASTAPALPGLTAGKPDLQPSRTTRDPPSLRPTPARQGADFWPTPPCLTAALILHVLPKMPRGPIWECAAGDGRLAEAIHAAGRDVVATDLYPRGGIVTRRDFLHGQPPDASGLIAITNPPFNQLDRFIARGLVLLDTGRLAALVLLVRHDALTAASRAGAFGRASTLWTCAWRPRWIEGSTGTGRWSNVWVAWREGRHGPPRAHWITPSDLRQPGLLV